MGFLPVILALCQTQLAVHDELCGGLKVGVAVCDGFGVLRRELAQHPCGKVVVRVGLCADADADAGEVLPCLLYTSVARLFAAGYVRRS